MMHLRNAGFAALIAGGLAFMTYPAAAQAPAKLLLSVDNPSAGALWAQMILPWAKKVEQESAGAIQMDLYPDGQLSKVGDTVNRVEAGIADIGYDQPQLYGARFSDLLITTLPGLYRDPEKAAAAFWRLYEKGLVGGALKNFKVIYLHPVPNASYYFKSAPKSSTDFTGLKIATSNKSRVAITQAGGGVPMALSVTDYYQSVTKGVVDGVMTTVGALQPFKVDEVVHHYVYGSFGGGMNIMVMNKAKYEALSPKAKKAIDDNSGLVQSKRAAKWLYEFENSYLQDTMLKQPGNKQVFLTKEDVAKFQPAFDALTKEWIAATPNGQAIYDAFRAEMAKEEAPL